MGGLAAEAFLFLGASILAGFLGRLAFRKLRVSDIIVLLAIGFLLGPALGLMDGAWLTPAMPILAPLGLVIILFEGGLELRWQEVRRHGAGALTFSVVSWGAAVGAIYLVATRALGLSPMHALLLAAAVGATGIIAVIPILAQVRASPQARVWLTTETGLGDLLSAVAVTGLAAMMLTGGGALDFGLDFGARVILGAAIGFLGGLAWSRALFHIPERSYAYALTLGALLVAYAATEALGGSGFLGALVFGLVVGNAGALVKDGGVPALASLSERSREHQGEIIFLLRSVYFVYLGMALGRGLLTPTSAWAMLALVGAIVAARVLVVALLHSGDRDTRMLLTGMMPRGMATMVLAATPAAMGVPGTEALIPLALLVVIGADIATSIGLFGCERRAAHASARAEAAPDA